MNSEQIYVVKADGTRELFNTGKLENSLKRAGASSAVAENIIGAIQTELADGVSTYEIYKKAFELLHKAGEHHPAVALKYSLKRAIMELGPSGFPFEEFVAEILRAQGFEAVTDQKVKGFCVEHEIDVVAWNDKKLIMVEAKFHNEPGSNSDLKVALYVKARFEDLIKMKFNYGGRERDLDEAWLVTNTKFTSTAIEYASCHGGLVMIGWNYPPAGNLQDMILEAKLHPVTCLGSLNGREKKSLLDRGIVLCKSIRENPAVLAEAGLNSIESQKVIEEIEAL